MKSVFRNILLTLCSVFFVLIMTIIGDRLFGRIIPKPYPEGTHDLIFPPLSHQEFASVDFTYVVETNSLGIREREISRPKPPNVFRIVGVGDSYTYGWGVNIEDTWLRKLEQLLKLPEKSIETINLGKPGAGPPFYAEITQKVVPLLEPDLILVGILQGNDIASAGSEGLEQIETLLVDWIRYLFPNFVRLTELTKLSKDLKSRTQERPPEKTTTEDNRRWAENTAKEFYQKMSPKEKEMFEKLDEEVKNAFFQGLLNPYMVDLALKNKHIYTLTLNPEDPWIKQCIENMSKALKIIKKVGERFGAKTAVLAIPDGPYVNEIAYKNIQKIGFEVTPEMLTSNAPDLVIKIASEKAGLPCFTVSEEFRKIKTNDKLFYRLDGHLTSEGHKLIAETLLPKLQEWLSKNE